MIRKAKSRTLPHLHTVSRQWAVQFSLVGSFVSQITSYILRQGGALSQGRMGFIRPANGKETRPLFLACQPEKRPCCITGSKADPPPLSTIRRSEAAASHPPTSITMLGGYQGPRGL